MKKNIGPALALYPAPVTVIGAMNGDKPTWTMVTRAGIIGHDHIVVSVSEAHFIAGLIKKNKKFSINIVDEAILPQADLCGSISGADGDKSGVFEYEFSPAGTPMISAAPVSMDCTVEDIYNTSSFENFICAINGTYVSEEHLNENDRINYQSVNPVLFDFPAYEYLRTGDAIARCGSYAKEK